MMGGFLETLATWQPRAWMMGARRSIAHRAYVAGTMYEFDQRVQWDVANEMVQKMMQKVARRYTTRVPAVIPPPGYWATINIGTVFSATRFTC